MPQNRWGHTVLRLVDVDILRDTANIYITMLNKILEDVHMYLHNLNGTYSPATHPDGRRSGHRTQ